MREPDKIARLPSVSLNHGRNLIPSGSVDVREADCEKEIVTRYVAKELGHELQYEHFILPTSFVGLVFTSPDRGNCRRPWRRHGTSDFPDESEVFPVRNISAGAKLYPIEHLTACGALPRAMGTCALQEPLSYRDHNNHAGDGGGERATRARHWRRPQGRRPRRRAQRATSRSTLPK